MFNPKGLGRTYPGRFGPGRFVWVVSAIFFGGGGGVGGSFQPIFFRVGRFGLVSAFFWFGGTIKVVHK